MDNIRHQLPTTSKHYEQLHDTDDVFSEVSGEGPDPLGTLRISPRDREAAFERLLGDGRFREGMSLILSVEEFPTPIIIQPPPLTVVGRTGSSAFDIGVIDLSPYDGRAKGVSRLHAALHRSKHTLAIEDMDSSNGTFVNGERLRAHEPKVLHDGDELSFALLAMRVKFS